MRAAAASPAVIRVGLIADTHGLLRPEALAALAGSDFIVHAGDIEGAAGTPPSILQRLARIAPVTAVRGNNDHGAWAVALGHGASLRVGELAIHVVHDIADLAHSVLAVQTKVVVTGHSHRPAFAWREGVLFINPGSAGPRRFKLPVTVGSLSIEGQDVLPQIHELDLAS